MTEFVTEKDGIPAKTQPIHVLLVDDNEQWVRFIGNELGEHPSLEVTIALNANEAIMELNSTETFECVVADYKMPEINGVQLLERIRTDHPNLPFILVTSEGSEQIASKAIQEGVTDYFQKRPQSNQITLLKNRIEQAVEQFRLQKEIRNSEERYRTITEQIWDAIVILQRNEVIFSNTQFSNLIGLPQDAVNNIDFIQQVIHPDDRQKVREVLSRSESEANTDRFHETRVVDSDGTIRICEFTSRQIPFRTENATLVSLRDVTERKNREKILERERLFNKEFQRSLITARTRDELESELAQFLFENNYDFVWIGEVANATLEARTQCGESNYLDVLDLSIDENERVGEPSIWSVRTGESKFIGDLSEMFSTQWRDQALDCGFRSAASIPLSYDEINYGTLSVYHEQPYRFDDTEKDLLMELADTLGFAIHHFETQKALTSESVHEVELLLTTTEYYLPELATHSEFEHSAIEFTVQGSYPVESDTILQYLELDSALVDTFCALCEEIESVTKCSVIKEEDPARLQITSTTDTPEIKIGAIGAVIHQSLITPGSVTLRFDIPTRNNLNTIVSELEDSYGSVSVQSCVEVNRTNGSTTGRPTINSAGLTERQSAALKAAYHHGYFDQPRINSATEIATSLDVSHSTFLQHLRVAQEKVFENLFGPGMNNK